MAITNGRYRGPLFRALNPIYAREPLSGRGAELYGGRFNARGTPALYTALDPATALREANQVGSLQPTVLVSYRADVGEIFDARDAAELARFGLSKNALGDPGWRGIMLEGRIAPTQELAQSLIAEGYVGIVTRSFAKGTSEANLNLILWRWTGDGYSIELIDDEDRLGRI